MSDTTPTGIAITACPICSHRHPVTRQHCPRCGLAHIFPCDKRPPTCACGLTDPEMPCLDCRFRGDA